MASVSHLIVRIIDAVSFQGRTQTCFPAIPYCSGTREEYTVQADSFGTWYRFTLFERARVPIFSANFAVFRAASIRVRECFPFRQKALSPERGNSPKV